MRIRVDLSRYDRNGMDWSPLSQPRWVGWRYENRAGKRIKPPRSSHGYASVTNPNTWGTRQQAETWENGRVGFVLGRIEEQEEHICGIDLDGCLDEVGRPSKLARQIINRFDTYTEASPSGRGLHLIFTVTCEDIRVMALHSQSITNKGGHEGVALDIEGRYYTVTDNIFEKRSRIRRVSRADLQWLLMLVPTQKVSKKDESRSVHAQRFIVGYLAKDESQEEIEDRLKRHRGAAGEWYREKMDGKRHEIDHSFESARAYLANGGGVRATGSVTFFADIEEQKVEWIRPGLARGTVMMFAGHSGVGKSSALYNIIARISCGDPWPCGIDRKRHEPETVLILNYEDPRKSIIKPRLRLAGANMMRVAAIDIVKEGEAERSLALATDLPILREQIERHRPTLVVIDPVSAFMGGHKVDRDHGRSGTDVRATLDPLARLAEEFNTTLIMVSHFRKEQKGLSALHMVVDSQAYTALPRIVFVVGLDPNDPDHHIMATAKNQFTPRHKWLNLGFELVDTREEISKVIWDEKPIEISPEELVASIKARQGRPPLAEVREFIKEMLKNGPVKVSKIRLAAEGHGFNEKTLYNARDDLGAQTRKIDGALHWHL